MASPRPHPTAVRKLRGNPGKRGYNLKEPAAVPGAPAMPEHMDPIAVKEWHRLISETLKLKVLSETDRGIVEATARAYSTWIRAEQDVNENGILLKFKRKYGRNAVHVVAKVNPACSILSNAWTRYRAGLMELGLTPAARTRVATLDQGAGDDPASKYFQ